MPRVLVVDGQRVFAEAIAVCLEQERDISVVATATRIADAREALARVRPDCLIVSVDLGVDWALSLVRAAREQCSSCVPILLLGDADADTATPALRAGVRGLVPKAQSAGHLVHVLRGALAGETHVPPALLTTVLDELVNARPVDDAAKRLDRLTSREREVLSHMVGGADRATIAETLYLSVNTVRTHVKNILAKLEVHSTLEAVGIALRAGIRAPDRSAVA